jgi:hypothetical protein
MISIYPHVSCGHEEVFIHVFSERSLNYKDKNSTSFVLILKTLGHGNLSTPLWYKSFVLFLAPGHSCYWIKFAKLSLKLTLSLLNCQRLIEEVGPYPSLPFLLNIKLFNIKLIKLSTNDQRIWKSSKSTTPFQHFEGFLLIFIEA